MLILSAIKIFAFLLVRQSHHTRSIRAGPKLFWTKFLWHCTGPGTLPHDPRWFFLAARVSERVTPFGRAMVLYGLCIYSGGETGYNEILSFGLKFTLKVKANPLKLYIGILTKLFCTSDPYLVILAWTGHKLSHGQVQGWHTMTYGHTDRHRQQQYPKAKTYLA